MRIVVNGSPREAPDRASLADLLAGLGLDPRGLAAAVNGCVVPRDDHPRFALSEGDRVELIRAVGGG
ncbi:sulfur carrier protein ThiS [Myxococcota bacterium]|nr:sulfur carrier protein ThiS [Myxococcota bacterium]